MSVPGTLSLRRYYNKRPVDGRKCLCHLCGLCCLGDILGIPCGFRSFVRHCVKIFQECEEFGNWGFKRCENIFGFPPSHCTSKTRHNKDKWEKEMTRERNLLSSLRIAKTGMIRRCCEIFKKDSTIEMKYMWMRLVARTVCGFVGLFFCDSSFSVSTLINSSC